MNYENIIIAIITGVISYFAGFRKSKKEIESITIINLEKSLFIYKEMIDDLSGRINQLNTQIKELSGKVDELMEENQKLKKIIEKKHKNNTL